MTKQDRIDQEKTVIEDLNFNSNKISENTRLMAYALIGLVYGILISDTNGLLSQIRTNQKLLLIVSLGCIFSIMLDWSQSIFGYWDSINALKDTNFEYSTNNVARQLRIYSFWFKQVILLISYMVFISYLFYTILIPLVKS